MGKKNISRIQSLVMNHECRPINLQLTIESGIC
jgi:hypothetical protein